MSAAEGARQEPRLTKTRQVPQEDSLRLPLLKEGLPYAE